ncbi:unnamed protein product [Vitrella brassicaformis CCMP3155]|uniref:Bestrophin homolog n=1 Tax=Vitrella brassicaformis (strain CCMP3155) TaxID=1169540 RepID=A0A0G4H0Y5_VITBC|nr:unnamed protein product [Vitrella brassicaformis CCMP3155]|eukprot:CEM37137.1 unnamed protein product [Vitrella brassicaformis CCMP3155]
MTVLPRPLICWLVALLQVVSAIEALASAFLLQPARHTGPPSAPSPHLFGVARSRARTRRYVKDGDRLFQDAFQREEAKERPVKGSSPSGSDASASLSVPNPSAWPSFPQLEVPNSNKWQIRRYESQDWKIRRYSSEDWLECLLTLPLSRIFVRIRGQLIFQVVLTTFIAALHHLSRNPKFLTLPSTPHSLTGGALGLLLVFRTNAAYSRFWEGRKCWGTLVTTIRELAYEFSFYMPQKFHHHVLRLLKAYPRLFKQHLQGELNLNEVGHLLTEQERTQIQTVNNPPLYLLRRMCGILYEAYEESGGTKPTERKVVAVNAKLGKLCEMLGACERIIKTPVPVSYSRHTSRFLTLYCATLPFALLESLRWAVVPVVAVMTWGFLSIQEIGHFIEDPFDRIACQIPMEGLCETIEADITDLTSMPYIRHFGTQVNGHPSPTPTSASTSAANEPLAHT